MDKKDQIKQAERAIQKLLIDLGNDIEADIESVEVDTRNYGQLSTTIYVPEVNGTDFV